MSSNNSDSVEWIPEVRCWCGEVAPVRMSWSYANPGKRFRACPRYGVRGNGNCRYFEWLDSDVSERVAKVIRVFVIVKIPVSLENPIQRIGCPSTSECPSTSACPSECPSTCSET
nr:uncharacterized protein LOC109168447 [Ipomoea batatas]